MSLKAEFEEFSKNGWGIGILISWVIFIVFALWNMILSFVYIGRMSSVQYVGEGVISLITLGATALYLLTVLIAKKVSYTKEQLYFIFSTIPLASLFIMAVVMGFLPDADLIWPYLLMLLGSIAIIFCTNYYIETKGQTPIKKDTVQTEDGI